MLKTILIIASMTLLVALAIVAVVLAWHPDTDASWGFMIGFLLIDILVVGAVSYGLFREPERFLYRGMFSALQVSERQLRADSGESQGRTQLLHALAAMIIGLISAVVTAYSCYSWLYPNTGFEIKALIGVSLLALAVVYPLACYVGFNAVLVIMLILGGNR
jgi:hypothetical protein